MAQPPRLPKNKNGQSHARYEFFGGPFDTEMCFVPTDERGEPLTIVYVEYAPTLLGHARGPVGTAASWPKASPDGFTPPWHAYRLKLNRASPMRSTYHVDPDEFVPAAGDPDRGR